MSCRFNEHALNSKESNRERFDHQYCDAEALMSRTANRSLTCRRFVSIPVVALGFFCILADTAGAQKRYPNWGDLDYNGDRTVNSYFMWERPGGWTVSDPGYEHNFAIDTAFYNVCTSWSDLPFPYDDCATAGESESNPSIIVFAFGSYHLVVNQCCNASTRHLGYHPPLGDQPIAANTYYFGEITFSCTGMGSCWAYSTPFNLYAQEVDRIFCQGDYSGCMNGTLYGGSNGLMSGTLTYGQTYYGQYHYDPVTGQPIP